MFLHCLHVILSLVIYLEMTFYSAFLQQSLLVFFPFYLPAVSISPVHCRKDPSQVQTEVQR